jgi:glutamate racemase
MSESISSRAIGMFDSGVGGLTVMREILQALPHEDIVYFGDTARVPYGNKSSETIIRYSIENAIFLMEKNVKVLVVACNTASAYSIAKLQKIFNIPVIGVIEPGVQKAVQATRNRHVAVIGTRATIQSGIYQQEIEKRLPGAQILAIPCPLFVPLVEERFATHSAAKLIVKEYLAPVKNEQTDTLLLGCTHYPLLRELIQDELGDGVTIVDSATTCAETVKEILKLHRIQSTKTLGSQTYFVSDDAEKFQRIGMDFLGRSLDNVSVAKISH